jgi:hypothetical protein
MAPDQMQRKLTAIPSADVRGYSRLMSDDEEGTIFLARLAGFEPATYGLEVRCSIQLSYRRVIFFSNGLPVISPFSINTKMG